MNGMKSAMNVSIDQAGRLVLPSELRKQAGIEPGMLLEARYADGAVVIEAAAMPIRIERRGRFAVAVPLEPVSTLTAAVVHETQQRLRNEHGDPHGQIIEQKR